MQLVLQQYGARLARRQDAFEVQTQDGAHKVSPKKIDSILLTRGVSVSTDALLLAIHHQIDVLLLDSRGQPQGRVWSHRFGSVSAIRKQQIHFAESAAGTRWIGSLIARRLQGQADLLRSLVADRPAKAEGLQKAIGQIMSLQARVDDLRPSPLDDTLTAQLRGWEGSASKIYFSALSAVVPEIYRFDKRSRRPALDIFNCSLNYLYGILYGRIEIALIKAGIDPFLGVFHRDEYNRPVLVYDLIEPFRVWAEAVLLQLCFPELLIEEMFSRRGSKGLWLDTAGKQLVIGAMNDYLAEVVQMNQKRRSRLAHLQNECHALAQEMLQHAKAAEEAGNDPQAPF